MATETETPTPAPVPSAGLIARLGEKFGFKTEATAFAEIKEELAAMTLVANEAAAEAELSKAEIARQSTLITGLQAKISGIDAVIPGITASADPAKLLADTIILQTASKVAEMGMKEADLPDANPAGAPEQKTLSHAEFKKLPPAEANAFMREGGKLTE